MQLMKKVLYFSNKSKRDEPPEQTLIKILIDTARQRALKTTFTCVCTVHVVIGKQNGEVLAYNPLGLAI